jgi:hypothetical protein
VDAIGDGQRNPLELAKLRDPRIKASEETMVKSLKGNWRPEHLFTLKQSRQMYRHYQEQIAACDAEIEKLLVVFQPRVEPVEKPLPPNGSANFHYLRSYQSAMKRRAARTPSSSPEWTRTTRALCLWGSFIRIPKTFNHPCATNYTGGNACAPGAI